MRPRSSLALALAVALAAPACAPSAQRRYEQRLEAAPAAAQHGVTSARLRELMRALGRLQHERLPQAMDVEEVRARQIDEFVRLALEMAASASRIPDHSTESGLDAAAREPFESHAARLTRLTRALADDAPRLTTPELRERVQGVSEVCDTCHARFRAAPDAP